MFVAYRRHGCKGLTVANELAFRRALEAAGVEFIDENGGGPGVRLGGGWPVER